MISSKFTDKLISFLSFNFFIFLVILLCLNQAFATKLDISDIERSLNNEHDNTNTLDTSNDKEKMTEPIDQISNSNILELQQHQSSTNSFQKSDAIENPEPLPIANKAKLIVLNKITTKSSEHILKVGKKQPLGNLSIEVHKCIKTNDPYNSNNWMLLTIFDNKIESKNSVVFYGWVLSSNQSLSTLEHPVYEIIPRDCIVGDIK